MRQECAVRAGSVRKEVEEHSKRETEMERQRQREEGREQKSEPAGCGQIKEFE